MHNCKKKGTLFLKKFYLHRKTIFSLYLQTKIVSMSDKLFVEYLLPIQYILKICCKILIIIE